MPKPQLPTAVVSTPHVRVPPLDDLPRLWPSLWNHYFCPHRYSYIAVNLHTLHHTVETVEINDSGSDEVERGITSDEKLVVRAVHKKVWVPESFYGSDVSRQYCVPFPLFQMADRSGVGGSLGSGRNVASALRLHTATGASSQRQDTKKHKRPNHGAPLVRPHNITKPAPERRAHC